MDARGAYRLLWLTTFVMLAVLAARRPLLVGAWLALTALLILVPLLLAPAVVCAAVVWSALRHHDGGRLRGDHRVISEYVANDS